jgi:hypothetical protein
MGGNRKRSAGTRNQRAPLQSLALVRAQPRSRKHCTHARGRQHGVGASSRACCAGPPALTRVSWPPRAARGTPAPPSSRTPRSWSATRCRSSRLVRQAQGPPHKRPDTYTPAHEGQRAVSNVAYAPAYRHAGCQHTPAPRGIASAEGPRWCVRGSECGRTRWGGAAYTRVCAEAKTARAAWESRLRKPARVGGGGHTAAVHAQGKVLYDSGVGLGAVAPDPSGFRPCRGVAAGRPRRGDDVNAADTHSRNSARSWAGAVGPTCANGDGKSRAAGMQARSMRAQTQTGDNKTER